MRTLNGVLSKQVQRFDARGLVYWDEERSEFVLERRGEEPVSLGDRFGKAQQAIVALRREHESAAP